MAWDRTDVFKHYRRSPRDRWYSARMFWWGNTPLHKHVRNYPVTFQLGCTYYGTLPANPYEKNRPQNHHVVPHWNRITLSLHLLNQDDTIAGDFIRI